MSPYYRPRHRHLGQRVVVQDEVRWQLAPGVLHQNVDIIDIYVDMIDTLDTPYIIDIIDLPAAACWQDKGSSHPE